MAKIIKIANIKIKLVTINVQFVKIDRKVRFILSGIHFLEGLASDSLISFMNRFRFINKYELYEERILV